MPLSLGRFKPVFTKNQERELAEHIKELERRFYGLGRKEVMFLTYQYAEMNNIPHRFNDEKKMAGRHWVTSFSSRQNLSLRMPEKCSLARASGFNRTQVSQFFENLQSCYHKYKLLPHCIYNMDETGLTTVPNKLPKVFAQKGKKCVSKIVSAERGQLVTAVCCMSASGGWVPPALIFPRKRMKDDLFFGAPSGTLKLISDSGYMNTDLFLVWIKHFFSFVKPTKDEPALLILDNHVSHCSLPAITFCRENNIILLTLPPHASHKMQPLDKGFFAPLKTAFSSECDKWMTTNCGKPITQKQMAMLFNQAYSRTATIAICQKSFEATGLYPFNPDIFTDEEFLPAEVTNIPFEQANLETRNTEIQPTAENPELITTEMQPLTGNLELGNTEMQPIAGPSGITNKKRMLQYASDEEEDNLPLAMFSKKPMFQNWENVNEKTPEKCQTPIETLKEPQTRLELTATDILHSSETSNVTPVAIIPYPKANFTQKRRKNSKKSEILTSTPYKDILTEKIRSEKDSAKRNVFKNGKK